MLLRLLTILTLFAVMPSAWAATDAPCTLGTPCVVAGGRYVVHQPPGWDGRSALPTLVFFHGWSEAPADVLGMSDVVAFADQAGILLVLPEGQGQSWSHPGSPARYRNEFAFVTAVMDDLERRFPVDHARLVAAGFSQGGSMVWNLACAMPERFSAFAPISGGFWEPLPKSCKVAPTRIYHVHGTSDHTVPMTGRWLFGVFKQGNIRQGWSVLQAANGCGKPVTQPAQGRLTCETASACPGKAAMNLCLHDGDHEMGAPFLKSAWDWIMALPEPPPVVSGVR